MSTFRRQEVHSDSSETSSYGSAGSAYQLILDHILTYPGSYELPLRTMYTLNCAPRAQPIFAQRSPASSASSSPLVPQGGWHDNNVTQSFTENLMAQMQQLPTQPNSLPPSFIVSFLRRCFPPELISVDFPQALTGLDYLKDLETRRRREVAAAMSRLAIDRTTLDMDASSLSDRYPGVMQWVQAIEEKERKVEALYTQLYIVLRRWILINELSLLPFNKHNCIAMLNTLYPPVISAQPTSKLTSSVLKTQRDSFFKYVLAVERQGPRILSKLMQQGKIGNEENGWLAATRTLGAYLQLATSIINECSEISDVQDVSPHKSNEVGTTKTARKIDSGVSLNSTERPGTRSSSNADPMSPIEFTRPKTPSGSRSGTALEKLARGLKTIGRSRTDVTEMVDEPMPTTSTFDKPRTLRKMRSMGALERHSNRKPELVNLDDMPAFDAERMRTLRMKYDADVVAAQKFGRSRPSNEV